MSQPPRMRGAIKRVTTEEVSGIVIRDGSSEPVEIEVRANGQRRALGRAEKVLRAGHLGYHVHVALIPGELVEVYPAGAAVGRLGKPHIVPPAGPLPSFGVGGIFRNEAPYITEWVAHHRLMGFRDIFIADNDSDDGTWELLQALEKLGYLKCFRFPNPPGQRPQLPAYTELMHRFGKDVDWMAFIDADEFVWPMNGERTAIPSLAGLASRPEVGAIVLNWAIYGSSWHTNHAAGLVTERFQRCAPRTMGTNQHHKTVLRTAAWSGGFTNPHLPRLDARWQVVHANGAPVVPHTRHGAGLSSEVVWDILRLNHYAVKSRQEFEERKRPKGRVSHPGERRETYFTSHDRNDDPTPVPEWSRARLAEEVARMEAELLSTRHAPPERPTAAVVLARPFEGIQGRLDDVRLDGGQLVLSGWALEGTGAAPARLALELGELRFESGSFRRHARPDLKRRYPMCVLECGYEWRIPTSAPVIPFERAPTLRLYAELGDGGWSAPLPHRVGCFGPTVILGTSQQTTHETPSLDAPSATAVAFSRARHELPAQPDEPERATMTQDKLKVFIGYDSRETIAWEVCRHSLLRHAKTEVEIYPIKQQALREIGLYTRPRDATASTEFSLTRFLTPYLAAHDGWTVFADCDFLFTTDITKVVEGLDRSKAVHVVQHDYTPANRVKMDAQTQTTYPRKNWSSFMVFNNAHPVVKALTPAVANEASPAFLHRLQWVPDDSLIGSLPLTWNFLVGEYPKPVELPHAIHFTNGGPWFENWRQVDYADLWCAERDLYLRSLEEKEAV